MPHTPKNYATVYKTHYVTKEQENNISSPQKQATHHILKRDPSKKINGL